MQGVREMGAGQSTTLAHTTVLREWEGLWLKVPGCGWVEKQEVISLALQLDEQGTPAQKGPGKGWSPGDSRSPSLSTRLVHRVGKRPAAGHLADSAHQLIILLLLHRV